MKKSIASDNISVSNTNGVISMGKNELLSEKEVLKKLAKEEKDKKRYIIDDYPHIPIPPEQVEIKNLVTDLELDIK